MAVHGTEAQKIQFYFTEEALENLDELQKRWDLPSRAETVRYALRWLQWTTDQIDEGNKFYLKTSEGIGPIAMPFSAKRQKADKSTSKDQSQNGHR
jgi:hypothetical protein